MLDFISFLHFFILSGQAKLSTDMSNIYVFIIIILFILILSLLMGFLYKFLYTYLAQKNKNYRLKRR